MADTPKVGGSTPEPDTTQAWAKFFIKMGFDMDDSAFKDIQKNLTPIQKLVKNFSKETAYKDSFFSKLPGFSKILKNLEPDTMKAVHANLAFGLASKKGADEGSKFYNNMGMMGRGLVNLVSAFGKVGPAAEEAAIEVGAAEATMTLGISLIIAAVIELATKFKSMLSAATDYSDKLNEFNRQLGGVGTQQLMKFNAGLNKVFLDTQKYGFALEQVFASISAYISSGIKVSDALDGSLIKTTNLISVVTGESAENIASFFSGIWRGSKLTKDSLEDIGNTFTNFNQYVSATGLAGQLNFGKFKEAIESTGTALLITATKGREATRLMMGDLTSLASLAQTLNISVAELNAKFEESSNLISSPDSPFRALLAISGGANFGQMLTNQFNRTDAMLKAADTLKSLNAQFGGNLNILGQVAERTFGLSKEVAIKLATMSDETRKSMRLIQEDSIKMHKDATEKSWGSLMNTLGNSWERFKNMFVTALQTSLIGNSGIQAVLRKLSDMFNNMLTVFGDPNSGISRLFIKLGHFVEIIFDKLEQMLEGASPFLNDLIGALDKFMKDIQDKGFWSTIGDRLVKLAGMMGDAFMAGIAGSNAGKYMMAAMLGGPVGLLVQWLLIKFGAGPAPGANPQIDSSQSSFITAMGKTISEEMSKVKEHEAKYEGLKDTDVVVDQHGNLTLAGLERVNDEEKELALDNAQKQIEALNKNTDNTVLLTGVFQQLLDNGIKLNVPGDGYRNSAQEIKAPSAQGSSPASTWRTTDNWTNDFTT